MKKRILTLAVLASLSLAIASCKSKTSDAPVVPPNGQQDNGNTGNNNGGETPAPGGENPTPPSDETPAPPTGPIQVDVNATEAINAPLVLKLPAGKQLKIGDQTYTVGANGVVAISELPRQLSLGSDDLEEVRITQPVATTNLTISSNAVGTSKNLRVDLSGATGLRRLVVAGYVIDHLDLSPMSQLTQLGLGQANKNTDIKRVTWPRTNNITSLVTRSPFRDGALDLNELPKLTTCRLITPYLTSISLAKSTELETLVIDRPVAGHGTAFTLDLTNNVKLKDLTLRDTRITKLTLKDNKAFDTSESNFANVAVVSLELVGMNKPAVEWILGKISKDGLTSATLPGYGFTQGEAPLNEFTSLTTVSLN